MRRLFKFKYPKIFICIITIALAYIMFKNPNVDSFVSHLGALSYLGIFIAGILFAFGFTAPFAVGFFIVLNPSNILLAGVIGGLGALLSDILIFKIIKLSFIDEFNNLKKTKVFVRLSFLIDKTVKGKIKIYLMYIFAGILIASPLPDEIGVTMLAGLSKIKLNTLAILSVLLNTLGILIILLI